MPSPPPDGQETAAVESPSLESSGDVHLLAEHCSSEYWPVKSKTHRWLVPEKLDLLNPNLAETTLMCIFEEQLRSG